MKRLIILFVALFSIQVLHSQVRIACVGNSITYGIGVANRERNSYPAQLQYLLGDNYIVKNFGLSGAGVIKKGANPYTSTYEYFEALQFNPDIVFIKLGTNDASIRNRAFIDDFVGDYKKIISRFRQLPSNPRIVLLLPVVSFLTDTTQQTDDIIRKQIVPRIQQVAYDEQCEIIDLYPLLVNRPAFMPDKLHPSSLGAQVIAKRIYEAVVSSPAKPLEIENTQFTNVEKSDFYGFNQYSFIYNNRNCKIVSPYRAAEGMPWVLRARFWGHAPQVDIALLERGFHIAYCDVAEMFGNSESVSIWNGFYDQLTGIGLSKKVVLEGMSRGGMYVYNWAIENPDKVACVYADAPVLDMTSWPGGYKKGTKSTSDWELYKQSYGFNSDKEALDYKGNPIHKAATIAKGAYPMLHVIGGDDKVVPASENTIPFEKEIIKAGGDITVIMKAGVGHHPHSLENPQPIIDFIVRATTGKINFAVIHSPAAEYRETVGWPKWADWWVSLRDIQQGMDTCHNADILFLGNSITQGMGRREFLTYRPGENAFTKYLGNYKWWPAGIAGDRIENILWRVQNMDYSVINPKYVVLTAGVNNFPDNLPGEIEKGIVLTLAAIREKMPQAKIILLGPLPCGNEPDSDFRKKYEQLHEMIARLQSDNVLYYKLSSLFISPDGKLNHKFCATDGVHFKTAGYEKWAEFIAQIINNLEKE